MNTKLYKNVKICISHNKNKCLRETKTNKN